VIDFMPPRGEDPDVVRIVEGVEGSVPIRMELVIRFGYGAVVPWVRRLDDDSARRGSRTRRAHDCERRRRSAARNLRTVAEFTVEAGERASFVLTWFPAITSRRLPADVDPDVALGETCSFWREWLENCAYGARWAGRRRGARW
jgi:hypothetical protein